MIKFTPLLRFWKSIVIIFTPIILLPILLMIETSAAKCAYIMIIIAIYWMTEVLPLAVTALIPVFAFPLLSVLSTEEVCLAYMNKTNMMFLGGLMIAVAIEHSNLHRRIAIYVILNVGHSPRRLTAGFMITTMTLSMWISNAAATAMMVPIVNAILQEIFSMNNVHESLDIITYEKSNELQKNEITSNEIRHKEQPKQFENIQLKSKENPTIGIQNDNSMEKKNQQALKDMCFLATAYAANIGGTGSPLGSAANLVTQNLIESTFTEETGYNFGSWVLFNVPGMLICTFLAWIWLQFFFIGIRKNNSFTHTTKESREHLKKLIQCKYEELGKITFHEKVILISFFCATILWFFRQPGFIPGWAAFIRFISGADIKISDASTTIFLVVLLFILPSKPNFGIFKEPGTGKASPSEGCLTWEVIQEKVPWGTVFLLGGGFAMAAASDKSQLSSLVGEKMKSMDFLPAPIIVFLVSLTTAMTTEIASNTATASVIMPVLKELALGLCVNPLYLIIPATTCCCYAFVLPAGTPPNAIVYSAANMKAIVMIRAGIVMNVICVIVINIMINSLGVAMFDVHNFPSWANSTTGTFRPSC